MLSCLLVLNVSNLIAQDIPQNTKNEKEQTDTLKPYQKNQDLPAFNVRLLDSVTIFNTYNIPEGKPVGLVLFDPDCKHCKHTIKNLLQNMDSVSNVQFYLVTPIHDISMVRRFYDEYKLADYKNIQVVGIDYEFFYFGNYVVRNVPDIALYDQHKELIKLIEGEFTATDIYRSIR